VKVVFADDAMADLEQIGDFIARDSPRRAATFIRELRQPAIAIGAAPRAFPLIARYRQHGIRFRAFGSDLIFYTLGDDRLAIVHVLHGARDYEALLFPDA
jgi:plasmid stabilization system protein ParE